MTESALIFSLFENHILAHSLSKKTGFSMGNWVHHSFPDGETYIQLNEDVSEKTAIIVCTLNLPDEKIVPLLFLAKRLKEAGAKRCILVAPYLSYMRQDRQFHPGEAITSAYFAELLSGYFTGLITVDPHLHRYHHLSEIYAIETHVCHAASAISDWVKKQVKLPLFVGPDSESQQWVKDIADRINAPFIVLEKKRFGDKDVEVSIPDIQKHLSRTPILVDDIISTAHTMIETVKHLKKTDLPAPICIGIHALFAGSAFEDLTTSGAAQIVSCNTIHHSSNQIKLDGILAEKLLSII